MKARISLRGANLGLALFALNIGLFNQIEDLVTARDKAFIKRLNTHRFLLWRRQAGSALVGGVKSSSIVMRSWRMRKVISASLKLALASSLDGAAQKKCFCEMRNAWSHQTVIKWAAQWLWTSKAFETISLAKVGTSAQESMSLLYLRRDQDTVIMNRERLLFDAKQKALELAKDYVAPNPEDAVIKLPGKSGKLALNMAVEGFHKSGKATKHDVVVSDAVARVLTGGDTDPTEVMTEDEILEIGAR